MADNLFDFDAPTSCDFAENDAAEQLDDGYFGE